MSATFYCGRCGHSIDGGTDDNYNLDHTMLGCDVCGHWNPLPGFTLPSVPAVTIKLVDVYDHMPDAARGLFLLLAERTPEQSISHTHMPTFLNHERFVLTRPYLRWYLIQAGGDGFVGAIYLSKRREIGVSIFRAMQRKGYARAAVLELMRLHPGKFLANVNPKNEASIKLWEALGFNLLQVTYAK